MSIFGKKKQETPPAPPMPSSGGLNDIKSEISGSNSEGNSGSVPMPPPPMPSSIPSAVQSQNSMPSPPPSIQMNSNFSSSSQISDSKQEENSNDSSKNSSNSSKSVLDESLFNLEDFELPNLDDLDMVDTKIKSRINQDASQQDSKGNSLDIKSNENSSSLVHHDRNSSHFIPTKGLTSSKEETFFLTTNEFKHLLELIDAVKDRVRISTQRHMKITTIKAEEDIEYENMKKDFQFIEDKLYEVDSTIFER